MMERRKFSTGAPWEAVVGYPSEVRADRLIEVSGTIAMDEQGHFYGICEKSLNLDTGPDRQ